MQARLDAIAYPPTHTYRLDGLKPTGPLADRLAAINTVCPAFFESGVFLDIGANKGFFSLYAQKRGLRVKAVEPDETCGDILLGLAIPTQRCTFREFAPGFRFNRILLGNGPHHLFSETGTYDYVTKLAAISDGFVIVEGPDVGCPDDVGGFDAAAHDAEMAKHFERLASVPSPSYTPGRSIRCWSRRRRYHFGPRPVDKWVRKATTDDAGNNKLMIGLAGDGVVKAGEFDPIAVEVAASSPFSNGLSLWWTDGWTEPRIAENSIKVYYQDEADVWRAFCQHNAYLSRMGYVDQDAGTINWYGNPPMTFDKNGVAPILTLPDKSILDAGQCLRQSYRTISPEPFIEALKTRSPAAVEAFFAKEAAK